MKVTKLLAILPVLAALTGCATGAGSGAASAGADDQSGDLAASLAGATFGRVPGPPVSCVEVAELRANRALGPTLLLFEGADGRLYANRTQSCPALRQGHQVRLKTVTARLCRGNSVAIVTDRGAAVAGNCTIGDFLTYTPRG